MNTRGKHKEDLGLDIPLEYFSKTKKEILLATINKKQKVFSIQENFYYWSAAVIALVVTLSVFNPFKEREVKNNVYNDLLISTLSVSDSEIDGIVEEFIDDNLLTENIFSE